MRSHVPSRRGPGMVGASVPRHCSTPMEVTPTAHAPRPVRGVGAHGEHHHTPLRPPVTLRALHRHPSDAGPRRDHLARGLLRGFPDRGPSRYPFRPCFVFRSHCRIPALCPGWPSGQGDQGESKWPLELRVLHTAMRGFRGTCCTLLALDTPCGLQFLHLPSAPLWCFCGPC